MAGAIPGKGDKPIKTDSTEDYEFAVYTGGAVIKQYIGDEEAAELTVPEKLGGKPVIGLDGFSFSGLPGLETLHLPDSLLYIGGSAFWGCGRLANIHFPEGLTAIGEAAFWGCKELQEVVLPSRLTSIGEAAFSGSGLTGLTIPESVEQMGDSLCEGCDSLEFVQFDNRPIAVPRSMFSRCRALHYVEGMENVTEIGPGAFQGCEALDTVYLPEGLKRLEEGTFSGCTALQHIALPSTLQHIGKNAFFASGLYEVEIPAGVETIDQFAFYYNQNLEEVTIHGASTVIEENAFTRNAYFVCYMPSTAVCDENAFNSDAEIRYID